MSGFADDDTCDLSVESVLNLSPDAVYRAFTDRIDEWFAVPGSLTTDPAAGGLYRFETEMDGRRHPHYGRFLALSPGERVEMTWVTGSPGTLGAETVVTVELNAEPGGTRVRLRHSGFRDEPSRDGHRDAWPLVLAHLEKSLAGA